MSTTVRGAIEVSRDRLPAAGDRPLLKISELAERSGVSAGTIRHYLREGLLGGEEGIVRTSRNMAYYPPELTERIELIKRLQEERFRSVGAPRRRRCANAMRYRATCWSGWREVARFVVELRRRSHRDCDGQTVAS